MVVLTNDASQTVAPTATVPFASNTIIPKRCSNITHDEGSGNIDIHCAGIYEISFNANVTSATEGAVIGLGVRANGETVVASSIYQTISVANSYEHISQTVRIKISGCGCVAKTISIANISTNVPVIMANAMITVDRIA